jgi:hypothetical protein
MSAAGDARRLGATGIEVSVVWLTASGVLLRQPLGLGARLPSRSSHAAIHESPRPMLERLDEPPFV